MWSPLRVLRRPHALHAVIMGVPLAALLLVLVLELHGWIRLLALLLGAALSLAAVLVGLAQRRASCAALEEALHASGDNRRELTSLQEALAHELKNPLASIKGLAGLIALDPGCAAERLSMLRGECCRMERILDEHLTFERPLTPLVVENVRIGELVRRAVSLYADLAGQRQIVVRVAGKEPVELACDPRKLKQMATSLLHNAIDASPSGGDIDICVERAGAWVRLSVLDQGPGVPNELMASILEPGVSTKPGGTGLGLTITRRLAEQHGGTLWLRNRPEGGFAATIDLPFAPPATNA
jgi:signal transduction histidine kinase